MDKLLQLRESTKAELEEKKAQLLDEKFNLRMQKSTKALDNPLRLRQIRREYAQVMTVLREDELGKRKLAVTAASILGETESKDKNK